MEERHRHRYEVNPKYVAEIEAKGMTFVGHSTDGQRMEIMEIKGGWGQHDHMTRTPFSAHCTE